MVVPGTVLVVQVEQHRATTWTWCCEEHYGLAFDSVIASPTWDAAVVEAVAIFDRVTEDLHTAVAVSTTHLLAQVWVDVDVSCNLKVRSAKEWLSSDATETTEAHSDFELLVVEFGVGRDRLVVDIMSLIHRVAPGLARYTVSVDVVSSFVSGGHSGAVARN